MSIALIILGAAMVGDFDFDGKRDRAQIVAHGRAFDIVIQHGETGKRQIAPGGPFSDPFISVNKLRGPIQTACGKGYDVECGPKSPNTVKLRGGELIYGQNESTSYVAIPQGRKLKFIQLSD